MFRVLGEADQHVASTTLITISVTTSITTFYPLSIMFGAIGIEIVKDEGASRPKTNFRWREPSDGAKSPESDPQMACKASCLFGATGFVVEVEDQPGSRS